MASFDSPEARRNYIMQGAQQRGIDPSLIDRLVRSEGGYSTFDRTGDGGKSFGPFQDYTGGGLGNTMRAQGLEPSDPRLETQNIDWNLNYIQQHGASPDVWHGLRRGEPAGTKFAEGVRPGEQTEGGTYVGVVHPTEDNGLSVGGALLLSGLLKNAYPEEAQEPTGNALLDGLIKGSFPGNEAARPQQQQPGAQQQPFKLPVATPPATVPDLASTQVPSAAQSQPLPTAQVSAAPSPQPPAPMPMVPQAQPQAPSSLGRLLSAINPIGTAQAGELPIAARPPAPAAPPSSAPPPGFLDTLPQSLKNLFSGPAQAEGAEAEVSTMMQPAAESLAEPVGMLAKDFIGNPIAAGVRGISGQSAPGTPQAIEDAMVAAPLGMVGGPPGSLGAGVGRGMGAGRGAAERIEPTFGKAIEVENPGGRGAEPPSETPGGEMPPPAKVPPPPKVTYQELDDDLFKAQQMSQAERLEAQKLVDELSAHGITPADSQEAYHIRESRMTKRPLPETEKSKLIEKVLSDLDAGALHDAQWIYEHAPDVYKNMPEAPLRTAQEGHVHRKVVGKQRPGEQLDPSEGDILTRTRLRGGSLSRKASGLMHRDPDYVWENNQGATLPKWGRLGDKGGPAKYGEMFTDQNGVKWTARQPTTRELTQHYPQREYVEDLIANTIDNRLRLGRVRRNVEILEKWKPRLFEEGLWYPENSQSPDIPANFSQVHVPQLRGAADPMVAAIVNDIFRSGGNNFEKSLEAINHVLIGSMFWLPIRHQLNVAAHYAVGRGFDNLYRNPNLLRAATEVSTLGPNYIRYLKEGAGLRYASTLNENFYNTLLSKLGHDIVKDPEWEGIAKALGFNQAQHLAETIYGASRRSLWKVNDVFLTARIMELEKAGKPTREAIRIAENEIPNYRLPTSNLALRSLLNSPLVAFGRYGYGRGRALVKTVQSLVGPKATGEERLHALGQALMTIVVGTVGYTIANHALQSAQKQLMGAMGDKTGKRVLGDKPLEFSDYGPFGITREAARYGLSYMPKSVQEANIPIINEKIGALVGLEPEAEDWSKLLGSLITASPVLGIAGSLLEGGRNLFTGQKMMDPHKRMPAEIMQGIENFGGGLNPVGVVANAIRKGLVPGVGGQLGVRQHYAPNPRATLMEKRAAAKSTARDPMQRGANQLYDTLMKQLSR